jgi:chemotaxis protein MotB
MGKKNPWEESDHEVVAHEAGMRASRSKRWLRLVVGLVVVGTLTFIGAYYVPLFRAHAALRDEFQQLSEARRQLDETLKNEQRELERTTKEKAALQAQLDQHASKQEQQKAQLEDLKTRLSSKLRTYETKGQAGSLVEDGWVRIALDDDLLFSRNSLTIPSKGAGLLCDIATASPHATWRVVAMANPSERAAPALAAKFKSPLELSAARAAAVANEIKDCNAEVNEVEAVSRLERQPKVASVKLPAIVLELSPTKEK